MALAKMQALATFLINQKLFAAEQFDYWMESGSNEYTGKKVGNGFLISRFRYDAVFSVERYSQSADLFLVLLSVWLMENDGTRNELDLPMPDVEVNPLDDHTVDLEVKMTFDEGIEIVADDNGLILYRGNRYSVAPAVITEASKVGVGDTQERPTDKPYDRDQD
tara:strand:- start:213 stop:704 length:492 start_codon:yes stop_codon:yes gene_type:complete